MRRTIVIWAFLSYLDNENLNLHFMQIVEFADIIETISNYDFDWLQHFRNTGLNVNYEDKFFFDTSYFKKLTLLLTEHTNAEIANLIHFLYSMNSLVFTTWYNGESLSANRYTDEECFTHMPYKSGVINKIINDYLPNKYSLIQNMFTNIIAEYRIEIKNSWLEDDMKENLLNLLKEVKLTTTDVQLSSSSVEMIQYRNNLGSGLASIIDAKFFHVNKLINSIYEGALLKNRKHISNPNRNNGRQLAPYVSYNEIEKNLKIKLDELCLPYFDSQLPRSWNYAYYGVAISREVSRFLLLHLYDAGYSRNFTSKLDCFKLLQHSVRDVVFLDELINNYVGLKMAYKAFKRNRNSLQSLIQNIQGLKNNILKQQFFIAYSAIYCEETNPVKVDMSAANLKSFLKAFDCGIDSPMNQKRKCDLWIEP
ncbi:endothelin-converting enzyme 1-like isoform X2 [Leptopilina heterotoma]|uniref:endothelin-converting enzyme 1-like isoform X2 n=1 Tax=Leptopilina heterotoma TaxID=63436 RepID=UPI001CA8E991|nr:endothelin-converting enzyme 1-like isoform X2 [Leptopilina heterotoma]